MKTAELSPVEFIKFLNARKGWHGNQYRTACGQWLANQSKTMKCKTCGATRLDSGCFTSEPCEDCETKEPNMQGNALSAGKRIPAIWARVWKAAFHEGRNLHCCAAAESTRAICGISISTNLVNNSPASEECCHECWRKVEEIANYWEVSGFPEIAEVVRAKLPNP